MHIFLKYNTKILVLLVPLCIWLISIGLSFSTLVESTPEIFIGITYDLTLLAPLVYLVLIWNTKVPKVTIVPVFLAGIVIASIITPANQNYHLNIITNFILPIVELGVISLILFKVRRLIKAYRRHREPASDFYSTLQLSAREVLGSEKLGNIFATEIGVFFYALLKWKRPKIKANQFTSYRENGIIAIFITIVFVLIAETIGLHFLLIKWNATIAWVIFGLSIYAAVQVLGHTKSMMQRFTEISENKLYLKYGLFGDVEINFENIERIEEATHAIKDSNAQKLALLGDLEGHNIILYLKDKVAVTKIYGITKYTNIVLLQLDDKKEFVEQILQKMHESSIDSL